VSSVHLCFSQFSVLTHPVKQRYSAECALDKAPQAARRAEMVRLKTTQLLRRLVELFNWIARCILQPRCMEDFAAVLEESKVAVAPGAQL